MTELGEDELAMVPRLLPRQKYPLPEYKLQADLRRRVHWTFRKGTPITQIEISNSVTGVGTGIPRVDQRRRAMFGCSRFRGVDDRSVASTRMTRLTESSRNHHFACKLINAKPGPKGRIMRFKERNMVKAGKQCPISVFWSLLSIIRFGNGPWVTGKPAYFTAR